MPDRALTLDYTRLLETLAPQAKKKWPLAVAAAWLLAPYASILVVPVTVYGLYFALGKQVIKYIKEQGSLSTDDAENIDRILDAGRKAGLEELEIEIDKERFEGLRAKAYVPKVNATFELAGGMAGQGKYKIRAKYREAAVPT